MGYLSRSIRNRIVERDNWICQLCGRPIDDRFDLTIDHKIPRANGGSDEDDNLQAAHRFCNELKGTTEFDMAKFLEEKPELPDPVPAVQPLGELFNRFKKSI